jgi:hypothetical protein
MSIFDSCFLEPEEHKEYIKLQVQVQEYRKHGVYQNLILIRYH